MRAARAAGRPRKVSWATHFGPRVSADSWAWRGPPKKNSNQYSYSTESSSVSACTGAERACQCCCWQCSYPSWGCSGSGGWPRCRIWCRTSNSSDNSASPCSLAAAGRGWGCHWACWGEGNSKYFGFYLAARGYSGCTSCNFTFGFWRK